MKQENEKIFDIFLNQTNKYTIKNFTLYAFIWFVAVFGLNSFNIIDFLESLQYAIRLIIAGTRFNASAFLFSLIRFILAVTLSLCNFFILVKYNGLVKLIAKYRLENIDC